MGDTGPTGDTGPIGPTGYVSSLPNGNILIGNSTGGPTGVLITGDATLGNTGLMTITGLQTIPVSNSVPATNDILSYNGSAWVPSPAGLPPNLTSGDIWIGNVSNVPTPTLITGDATLSNTGTLTLKEIQGFPVVASLVAGGSDPIANEVLTYNGTDWVPSPAGLPPNLASGDIWVGNATNVPTATSLSGDATLSNTGALTVTQIQGVAVSATAPIAGQVLTDVGGVWTPATPATTVTMGGDVTGASNTSKVVKIQGVAVSATAPIAGQVLTDVGGVWTPATPAAGGTVTSISAGTGITCTPNPITTTGSISVSLQPAFIAFQNVDYGYSSYSYSPNSTVTVSSIPASGQGLITGSGPSTIYDAYCAQIYVTGINGSGDGFSWVKHAVFYRQSNGNVGVNEYINQNAVFSNGGSLNISTTTPSGFSNLTYQNSVAMTLHIRIITYNL